MAQLIIPAGGAFLGSFFGPTGAQIGWLLGSWGSQMMDKQPEDQSKLGDLRIQTSQYNVPIPVVYGKARIAGNITWAIDAELGSKVEDSGGFFGKGGALWNGTDSAGNAETYLLTMMITICEGPILGISKIWADGDLIVDCTQKSKKLVGRLYTGTQSQMPDPTMEAHLGVGNVPAYRGISYIVLNRFNNGPRPTPPQFSFEVIKEL